MEFREKPGKPLIFLSLAAALISIKGLSLTPPTRPRPSFLRLMPQSVLWFILFLALWIGLTWLSAVSSHKQKKTAFGMALFYWACFSVGYFLKEWGTVSFTFWSGLNDQINFICYEFGYFCLFYCFNLMLIRLFDRYKTSSQSGRLMSSSKLLFAAVFCFLLICWLPWFLRWAPVITTGDSNNHISQASGSLPLMDNHPILYTLYIRLLFHLGGSNQAGAFLYSILQLLMCASVFSACACFVDRVFQRRIATIFLVTWFAFYPLYPILGITMLKDIPFGFCLCLIVLNICELRLADPERQKKLLIWNVILSLILCFTRHNGFLIFIPTAVVLAVQYRDHRRLYVPLCLAAITFYVVFQYVLIPAMGVEKWRQSEGFSIPLQQIARTVFYDPDGITPEQEQVLSDYFYGLNLAELYNPVLSNNVKYKFNEGAFAKDPMPMIKLWWDLFKTHPKTYLESILQNSYGYWYPEAVKLRGIRFGVSYENLGGIHSQPLIQAPILDKAADYLRNDRFYSMPVLAWLFTPGLYGWLLFFMWRYSRYSGNRMWPAFVPLLSLWIQMLGCPAFCEYRYVYGLITSLPLMICCTLLPITAGSGAAAGQESIEASKSVQQAVFADKE